MKVFIEFGGVIADTEANKKLSLVIKGKKIPRLSELFFKVPETIRL